MVSASLPRSRFTVRRRGFTLVELLVVIAIIGVLVGLLLPAVQAAREAARRMQCQNNLKQVGLALHNYSGAHGGFPSHTYYDVREDGSYQYSGWIPQILPYFEQANLAELYDHRFSFFELQNAQAMETRLSVLECPSNPGGLEPIRGMRQRLASGWTLNPDIVSYPADYSANRGFYDPVIMPQAAWDSNATRGMFDWSSNVKFRDVTDGTTNTIFVHESAGRAHYYVNGRIETQEPSFQGWFDHWSGTNSGWTYGFQDDGVTRGGPRVINATNRFANPYSFHPGGANFLLVDGSVRFIAETVDAVSFFSACSRGGGEINGEL
jgi:prepilin-type N-terminal cleavage/methylation domain-containing protein/prepilin-type processing-associated H-X9-DG protein